MAQVEIKRDQMMGQQINLQLKSLKKDQEEINLKINLKIFKRGHKVEKTPESQPMHKMEVAFKGLNKSKQMQKVRMESLSLNRLIILFKVVRNKAW